MTPPTKVERIEEMPGGRPRTLSGPDEFEEKATAYLDRCEASDELPTINGLCVAVGLRGREALAEYGRRAEYSDAIKAARVRIEARWEAKLAQAQCVGAIFWLKNQGWTDRQEVAHELQGDGWGSLLRDLRARKRGEGGQEG